MLYELKPINRSDDIYVYWESFDRHPDWKLYEKYNDFIVKNKGDGKFLNYTRIKFKTQTAYNKKNIEKEDYLESINFKIPIFSQRFVECFKNEMQEELDFIECDILCDGNIYNYYIGKILKTKKLVERQTFDEIILNDGTKSERLQNIIYNMNIDENDFLIARDESIDYIYLVNEKFKKLVKRNNLKIVFGTPI